MLNPWRKAPRQARAETTVEAIFEATVQLLLVGGSARLTTTRVAARAGVSVGTMYQYFPNKRALLLALFDRHVRFIAQSIEQVCDRQAVDSLADFAARLVTAFLSIVQRRPDQSRVAYGLLAEPENAELIKALTDQIIGAVGKALTISTDASFDSPVEIAMAVTDTLAGSARSLIERGLVPEMICAQHRHLTMMISGYLHAAARPTTGNARQSGNLVA